MPDTLKTRLLRRYETGAHVCSTEHGLERGRRQFSRSIISFKPKAGDIYIFPGWLLHGAEPFRGASERRSLAFNAFVRGGF
jgi:hypothetical protein